MDWKKTLIGMGLSAFVFGMFWHIWNLCAGSVPTVSSLPITGTSKETRVLWDLPFPISRSWDVFLAPVFILIISWINSRERPNPGHISNESFYGPFVGILSGMFVISVSFTSFVYISLLGFLVVFAGLLFGTAANMDEKGPREIMDHARFVLIYGVYFGFVVGIFWTIPVGFVTGVVTIIPAILLVALFSGLAHFFRSFRRQPKLKESGAT